VKVLAIALKDTLRELRSFFTLFMALGAPLLVAGLMYLAFGGLGRQGPPRITPTRLAVANLDEPDPASGTSLGRLFLEHLSTGTLAELVKVSAAADGASARTEVDRRLADAALIIPAGFSAAVLGAGPPVSLELYRDPTLTFGPSLVSSLLASFLDGALGAQTAARLAAETSGPAQAAAAAQEYVQWSQKALTAQVVPPAASGPAGGELSAIMGAVMTSMLLFFVFFTGASAAQSLVREREEGTLARLAATPTRPATILAGKSLAILLILAAQLAALLALSALLFGIRWGRPGPLALASAALIVAATGLGLLLLSLVRSSRQVGMVLGLGLTLTAMLGGLFTNFIPGIPDLFGTVSLAMPQGWAVRVWKLALAGADARELALPALVLTGIGVVCFLAGVLRVRRDMA